MTPQPPETAFYEDAANSTLWRDVSRLYEDFVGPEGGERKRDFERVLSDTLWNLEPMLCRVCDTPLENAAEGNGTELKCPKCGWGMITVTQMALPPDARPDILHWD